MRPEKRIEEEAGEEQGQRSLRLIVGLGVAIVVMTLLIMSFGPGGNRDGNAVLSQALLSGRPGLEIDSQGLASRVVEQKFQVHMEEADQEMGEIPYVEVWVLNDPFYPLMGEASDLRKDSGTLSSKEWQMLDFPNYEEAEEGTATGAPAPSAPTGSTPVTTGITQRVVLVESISEIRGIRYATIKVNDSTYDMLKAGSEFGEVFKLKEIKDAQTLVLVCGDEEYELKVDQLRKI